MAKKIKHPKKNLIVSTSHVDEFVDVSINDNGSDDTTTISIRTPRSIYVAVGDKVVYIDYTLGDLIVTSWKADKNQ